MLSHDIIIPKSMHGASIDRPHLLAQCTGVIFATTKVCVWGGGALEPPPWIFFWLQGHLEGTWLEKKGLMENGDDMQQVGVNRPQGAAFKHLKGSREGAREGSVFGRSQCVCHVSERTGRRSDMTDTLF